MLFNSYLFLLVFFPITTLVFFCLPQRTRWAWLLFASSIFYMAFVPEYILILALTIGVDYWAAIRIERSSNAISRKRWLVFSIIATCLILFVFKYFNFVNDNVKALATVLHWSYSIESLRLVLPIGLSFHTFQSLSYVIEVYREKQKAEHHFGIYALYVMFYPQLVAGPIERPQNLLHQFHEPKSFDYERVVLGLYRMAWGLFKKVAIADRLAIYVTHIYKDPASSPGLALILATFFFAIQVYCDFSGYSDIAVGAAQVMGFKLMENFNRPYAATTLTDFWRRWHISLSTWLRDYIFEPLAISWRGGGVPAIAGALIVTFLVSGFWHGAAWTFVCWGLLHGVGLALEMSFAATRRRWAKLIRPRVWASLNWGLTFGFVCFAYVFFRSADLHQAAKVFSGAWTHWGDQFPVLTRTEAGNLRILPAFLGGLPSHEFFQGFVWIAFLEVMQRRSAYTEVPLSMRLRTAPAYFRWSLYYATVLLLVYASFAFKQQDFIYFQF